MMGMLVAMLVVYAHAMAGPLPGDEISTADSGMLRLISLAGVVLLACDGISDIDRLVTVLRRLAFAAGLVALLGLAQYVTGELFVDRIRMPGLTAGTEGWTLGTRSGRSRPSGTSMSPIEYGVVLGMALPLVTCVRLGAVALPLALAGHARRDDRVDLLLHVALGVHLRAGRACSCSRCPGTRDSGSGRSASWRWSALSCT